MSMNFIYGKGLPFTLTFFEEFIFGSSYDPLPEEELENIPAKNIPEKSWENIFNTNIWRFILLLIFYICYRVGFHPMNRVKKLTDIGWSFLFKRNTTKKRSLAEMVREVQRKRKIGDLPPVYPNGWFAVEESRNVAVGQVKSVQCLGETLAIFRAEDGVIHVLDAYCPHLGANMAVGGVVKGDCLECPFHGWVFSGENGACTEIPYAKKVPDFAKVKSWISEECNGFIFLWYDAEGREPQWQVPVVKEISNGTFSYRGRTEHHVLAHIQEIPENGSDLAHLGHLHVPNIMKGADLSKAFTSNKLMDIVQHEWKGGWRSLEAPNSHIAEVSINHTFSFFGGKFKFLEMDIAVEQVGPALVFLHFTTVLGKGVLIQTVTPQEPLRQLVIHQFYSSSTFIAPIAKLVILGEAFHVERDIMIWNSKKFLSKPLLVAEDKLILRYRRWYSQFYSENSPKLESFRKESLDW